MLRIEEATLRCSVCRQERRFPLTAHQFRVLEEGTPLQFQCSFCCGARHWGLVKHHQSVEASQVRNERSILLVDDDEQLLRILQLAAAADHLKIETAKDGMEGLAKLAAGHFDLLVCDVNMPSMDGIRLVQHTLDSAYILPTQVLFLTGDASAQTPEFVEASGCHVLGKPFALCA